MSAANWTTRDRWRDVRLGFGIGVVLACSAIAYSPRLTSALHALGSPLPAMASAPVLEPICQPDDLTTAERVQLEDTRAFVGALPAATHRRILPVTTRATGTPPRQRPAPDQIGELIAANR